MFESISLLLSCIFASVTTNPLQGFPFYPVNQYQNELSTLAQPWYFNSYSPQVTTQNQLTQTYNDYVQRAYLNSVLPNQLSPAVDSNDRYGYKVRRYASDPSTDVVNNYFIIPAENIEENKGTVQCKKKESKCKTSDQKTNRKCRKRNKSKNIKGGYENKKKCSGNRTTNGEENVNLNNINPTKACKRNKCQKSSRLKEKDSTDIKTTVDKEKQSKRKNSISKAACNQNSNNKGSNKNKLKCNDSEVEIARKPKRVKSDKSNHCRKQIKKEDSCNCGTKELDDYFDINENCINLDNRCVRNDDKIKNKYQQSHMPIDFPNDFAPYMMFNQQIFDANGFYPINFDYFYNMQHFPTFNSNGSNKKSKHRATNSKKKRNNGKKNNLNNKDPKQSDNGREEESKYNIELSPFVESTGSSPVSTKSTNNLQSERVVQKCDGENSVKLTHDAKENPSSNCYSSKNNQPVEDYYIDDYYPEFHSDNFYTSKEDEYDWNNFHDRHYYSSNDDMNDLGKETIKYNKIDDMFQNQNDKNINCDAKIISTTNIKITTTENEDDYPITIDISNKEENEEIQFRTPPALDFPDFKTEMINKENNAPKAEIYYKPNESAVKKSKNNKMSVYSNVKNVENNDVRNKIIDQHDVETVLGHSKVIKYGVPPTDEESSKIYNDDSNEGDNPSDGETIVVIAKSLPYTI